MIQKTKLSNQKNQNCVKHYFEKLTNYKKNLAYSFATFWETKTH